MDDSGTGRCAYCAPGTIYPNLRFERSYLTSAQGFWAIQIIYKFTINLTKISILLLYLRIFPNKSFRKAVYGLLVFVIGYAVASITATTFQCTPVARTFDHDIPGTCINNTAFWYANAGANILSDFAILALPMPVVNSLHLPRRQKLGLMVVFALGGLLVSPLFAASLTHNLIV